MSFLEIKNVNKKFGNIHAVNDVSLSISQKEIFGLLGPNGAGKSTLISMISTLVKPDSGKILIKEMDSSNSKVKKALGIVPQEIALYPTLTAEENLSFWGSMYGIKGKKLKTKIDQCLEIAGLQDRKKDFIGKFSGGMKRRINIASALLHEPELLIMDEPTVGIDPQSRNHILETVLNLNKEGMTIIYTSHYMEEVEFLCSKIAIMDDGKIIANGKKDELKKLINNKDTINIELSSENSNIGEKIKSSLNIENVILDNKKLCIMLNDSSKHLSKIINIIEDNDQKIHSISIDEPNLENVFLHLTGKALRD